MLSVKTLPLKMAVCAGTSDLSFVKMFTVANSGNSEGVRVVPTSQGER